MEKLPQELLGEIVKGQSREDLHKIRLIELESLDALTGVSEHPLLSQYVKKIVFSLMRFIEYTDESTDQTSVSDALESTPVSLNSRAISLGKHIVAYKKYILGQKYLASDSLDVEILSRAFAKLSRVEIFDLNYWTQIAGKRLFDEFGPQLGKGLVTLNCEYTMPVLFQALSASKIKIRTFKLGQSDDFHLSAHVQSKEKWQQIRRPFWQIQQITWEAFTRTFCKPDKFGCSEVLSELRELELELELELHTFDFRSEDITNVDRISEAICEMIRSSPLVESVIIGKVANFMFTGAPKPLFKDFFPAFPPHRLHNLTIGCCESTLLDVVGFFSNHRLNIKDVELYSMDIIDGSWSEILTRLREFSFPQLKTFKICHCIDSIGEICVRDYIVHKTNVDPIQEALENQEREGY